MISSRAGGGPKEGGRLGNNANRRKTLTGPQGPSAPASLTPKWEGKKLAIPVGKGIRTDQREFCFVEALRGDCASGYAHAHLEQLRWWRKVG